MRTLLFCSPQGNQRALAHRLMADVPISEIVVVKPRRSWVTKKKSPWEKARAGALRIMTFAVGFPLRRAWFGMLEHYDRLYPSFPAVPLCEVEDINDSEVMAIVERVAPQLVVVSGTNLLRPALIELIGRTGKVVNLHTGISPYIKGGPNCTNWALALRRFDLIGNTVMWLDAGIDSGNLIATARTPLSGQESLPQLHIAVMDHAHDLYVRCIRLLAQGRTLPNVRQQDLGEGRLFFTRHWVPLRAAQAVLNFYVHYKKEVSLPPPEKVVLLAPDGQLKATDAR